MALGRLTRNQIETLRYAAADCELPGSIATCMSLCGRGLLCDLGTKVRPSFEITHAGRVALAETEVQR